MNLTQMHCNAEHARQALTPEDRQKFCESLPEWEIIDEHLVKNYAFLDYYETMAFVNALAWIAHQEDHHPDLSVHYNRVRVEWSTHDAGHLTLNDFICAARCEMLRPLN